MIRVRVAGALLAAAIAGEGTARAELGDDADVLAARFASLGPVTRLAPRFYQGGAMVPLSIPPAAARGAAAKNGCLTVTVLGSPSVSFDLHLPSERPAETGPGDDYIPSVAGAAELTRCGSARAALAELSIAVRSPHGVIETLTVATSAPPPSLRRLLPHRDPGPLPPSFSTGTPPEPAPIEQRMKAIERGFHLEGLREIHQKAGAANEGGAGRVLIDLPPGCHKLAVIGGPATGQAQDIDAELDWVSGGTASVDRTDSPDATLSACNGQREVALLAFAGAAPNVPVLMIHGQRELPSSLPTEWGPEARARMAQTFMQRHTTAPESLPIHEFLGVGGITELPFEVEPGACYLAAAASIQGNAKLASLTVSSGAVRAFAHTDDPGSAAMVAFCAGVTPRAIVEVEMHGAAPMWIAAIWPTGHRRLGEPAP